MSETTKHAGGRPPKFVADTLLDEATRYFYSCVNSHTIPNKAGLMLWLDISRATYSEYRDKFPNTVSRIDAWIEDAWLQRLTGTSPTGAIFYLKNAFKEEYKDKHETDITSQGERIDGVGNVAEIAARAAALLKEEKTA